MKIEELDKEGLHRKFAVTVDVNTVEEKMEETLNEIKSQVRMPGFRPGKAPISLLKKLHGDAVRGQVLQELVNETSQKVLDEKSITPAIQPDINVTRFEDGSALEYTMDVDIMPDVDLPDFSKIKIERPKAEPAKKEVEEALQRIAEGQKQYEKAPKSTKAKDGDAVLIDFTGKMDGEEFEGGSAAGYQLVLGSGSFIPGFEDQLVGAKAGDKKTVKVTFPENYGSADLSGKEAEFDVTVQEVQKPKDAKIDDDFAKSLGLENLDALKETVKQQLSQELEQVSYAITKRRLLDKLAEITDFDVPGKMVEMEFQQIWESLKREAIQSGEATEADFEGKDGPDDKKERAEYESIAERRVRLGLLLSEAGKHKNVQIQAEEINRRLMQEAQRYPGQEKEVMDYYRNNEQAMASLRAPIYEEKVCAAILDEADVAEKKMSREELTKTFEALEQDEEVAPPSEAKGGKGKKKAAKKTAPAKKTAAKKKAPAKKSAPAKKKAPAGKSAARAKAPAKKTAAKRKAGKAPAKKATSKAKKK